ncbi:MAG: Cation-independent mannose-6-phosphate receptor CI-MPR [Chaenotheca gracillima]|nr:MAG: Cation-independent mannose-6-phosphate receptor CI-MPR [Chaenotheca gracillima]
MSPTELKKESGLLNISIRTPNNKARVIQDVGRLIVPSPETLTLYGAQNLKHLVETVGEEWYKSIPLFKSSRPKPDFSVGFRSSAFTDEQRVKLSPYVGGWQDTSLIVAMDEMYFPFLTVEVTCGNDMLYAVDRQNAHSASIAVSAVVGLYRAVSREDELHGEILAFSVSHNHNFVNIYGHYALINGHETSFYRHLIHQFSVVARGGKKRWTAYKFTRNVYDTFAPLHLKRICAAVDRLPGSGGFKVTSQSEQSNAKVVEGFESPSVVTYSEEQAICLGL